MLCATSMVERMDTNGEQVENRLSLSTNELLSMSEEITKLLQTKEKNKSVDDDDSDTIADLEHQVDMLTNKLNSCKERTQSELEYFNLVLENRNEEIQQMQKNQLEKEYEMKDIKKKLRNQETVLDQKENLVNRHQLEIEELKEELQKQTKKLNTLKAEKEKFARGTEIECEEKMNRIVSFNDNVSVKTFDVEDPTEALQKEMKRMRSENEKLKSKLDELKWQMKAKDIMVNNSVDTVELMEDQTEQIEMLQEKVDELEEKLQSVSSHSSQDDNNNVTNVELQSWKEKVEELEMKLEMKLENKNLLKIHNKLTPPPVSPKPMKKQLSPVFKEETVEMTTENVYNTSPDIDEFDDTQQREYLSMLEQLRDSFYTELKLNAGKTSNAESGKFETILDDFRFVLDTLRLKLSNVLEESVKENTKEIQRMQSLKRMNASLKDEINRKTENYGNTVKSLEVKNDALSKSMVIQQQLNEELSEMSQENARERKTVEDQVNELKLKMMIRDSEVDRLKMILEEVTRSKSKQKKLGKKDKKKSNSLSNLLK